jgi:protein-tyrosine-phosphatase
VDGGAAFAAPGALAVPEDGRPPGDDLRRYGMPDKVYNVLFLCTGNSARSIMAECAINRWGQGKFRGFSAGSQPKGAVHPVTLRLLKRLNYRTDELRSKSWAEFAAGTDAPLDFVFTVCDQAAGEACPAWPGQPMTAHWGVEDPAAFVGSEAQTYRFFRNIYGQLENRIKIFTSLPIRSLDRLSLQQRIEEIGAARAERAAS